MQRRMKVLVTGGTGVIGSGVIPLLIEAGHAVRLLSRHADDDAARWTKAEAINGDVSDAASLRGVADQCDIVVHIAGIVAESGETTFDRVNVGGTRNMLAEAERAGVKRFVFVSSLGADRGTSPYHQSKRQAEDVVRHSSMRWTILRPGNVYGPGDDVVSLILKLVRTSPAVPVVDDGSQPFQPIYFEDLGHAIAAIISRDDLDGETLEIGGSDVTSMNDLLERFRKITDRKPLRVPLPASLARFAIDENKLTMLLEDNVLHGQNGLQRLGITPTALQEGLEKLASRIPEALPEDGVGKMEEKRFWADIRGSQHNATALMRIVRDRITELMPIEFAAEPDSPTRLEPGATLTGKLPLRGHFQVRVERVDPQRVVLGTIEGHPLAGVVEFITEPMDGGVRFIVATHTRASSLLDLVALKTVGTAAQNANWREVVNRVIGLSGGNGEIQDDHRTLSEDEASEWESSIRAVVQERMRSTV